MICYITPAGGGQFILGGFSQMKINRDVVLQIDAEDQKTYIH